MAVSKRGDRTLVRVDGPSSLSEAREVYRVPTREVCRALMCSRAYVDANVRPEVHHIYVTQKSRTVPHGTYYSAPELEAILGAGTVERRTVLVWPDEIVADEPDLDDLRDRYAMRARHARSDGERAKKSADFRADLLRLVRERARPEWAAALSPENGPAARGGVPWVCLGDPSPREFRAGEDEAGLPTGGAGGARWRTVADMTGYGDTSEAVHRTIWSRGMCRLTIAVGGAERVMYAPVVPPPPVRAACGASGMGELVAVPAHLVPSPWLGLAVARSPLA